MIYNCHVSISPVRSAPKNGFVQEALEAALKVSTAMGKPPKSDLLVDIVGDNDFYSQDRKAQPVSQAPRHTPIQATEKQLIRVFYNSLPQIFPLSESLLRSPISIRQLARSTRPAWAPRPQWSPRL